jgi:hypothetical protein
MECLTQRRGSPDYDSTTYTRIGNTINHVRFRAGKPVEVGRAVIVPGKTYTITEEGIDANNQPYHRALVFDRQKGGKSCFTSLLSSPLFSPTSNKPADLDLLPCCAFAG